MRLIVVSNRLPFTVSLMDGRPQFQHSSGGLSTGLSSYLCQTGTQPNGPTDFLWLGWPGCQIPANRQSTVSQYGRAEFRAVPVFLPQQSIDAFYHGFCNKTLWPLFHYFPSLSVQDPAGWQEYKRVNRLFGEALFQWLRPDDVLWIHDYHLMLLPKLVRERFPSVASGFFLHIPFPCFEVFRLLRTDWCVDLIEGMLGANLIGFHTHDYVRNFLGCALRTSGYEHQLGRLMLRDRIVKVDTFPMGIDFEAFQRAATAPETLARVDKIRAHRPGQKIIFSVDRLDYTKGLINRLRGYELFLKRNPQWHGKVVFIISVAPSRTGIDSYQEMKTELEELVGQIIGSYADVYWTPLVYQFRNLSFDEIVAMYSASDVALITPLRDGMNLVAKEFVASKPDQKGVLILSEMAGAAKEMGEAIIINPFHEEEVADALERALTMRPAEQVRRNRLLRERLSRYNVTCWADDFVQTIIATQKQEATRSAKCLRGKGYVALVRRFRSANARALLLDYDGTLVPFADSPALACPDPELLQILASLANDQKNHIAIVSGRPRKDLEQWFGRLPMCLIAEHGMWLRSRCHNWRTLRAVGIEWKDRVRPLLQLYVDRLPGALLEEKEFSLAWHYRRADPELASVRAKELLDHLADYTRHIELQVLEGNKVLEVRTTGITKGTAALEWLANEKTDLIIALGDDGTDEDLFRTLPAEAVSIRVGLAKTSAGYYLDSYTAVRRLLRGLRDATAKLSLGSAEETAEGADQYFGE